MDKKPMTPRQRATIDDIQLILGIRFGGKYDYEAKGFIQRYYGLARQQAVEELHRYLHPLS